MESEKIVHVVGLGGADATQWLELLHLLAARPEGPPHLRLTAVHEHKDVLTQTAMVLTKARPGGHPTRGGIPTASQLARGCVQVAAGRGQRERWIGAATRAQTAPFPVC